MRLPLIGITLDYETPKGKPGEFSSFPYYAVRDNYCASVAAHGGIPLPLPHEVALAEKYLELIDGLLITGGNFDIDPSFYGASERHSKVTTKDRRTAFEMAITQGALAQKKPILGICGGEQLLNVILGGTLIQHIPDTIANALEHEQPTPRSQASHGIAITPGTLLHRIVGATEMQVNSSHHQAVQKTGKGVIVNCTAPDGVIEGIEYPDHPFCLGVEWHPEYGVSEGDKAIFRAFIKACSERK